MPVAPKRRSIFPSLKGNAWLENHYRFVWLLLHLGPAFLNIDRIKYLISNVVAEKRALISELRGKYRLKPQAAQTGITVKI